MRSASSLADKLESAAKVSTTNDYGCWLWPHGTNKRGYGRVWDGERRTHWLAHRAAYYVWREHLPRVCHVHHTCATRGCFRPDHLQVSTPRDNNLEMMARQSYADEVRRLTEQNDRLLALALETDRAELVRLRQQVETLDRMLEETGGRVDPHDRCLEAMLEYRARAMEAEAESRQLAHTLSLRDHEISVLRGVDRS